jgi:hypothetical protein
LDPLERRFVLAQARHQSVPGSFGKLIDRLPDCCNWWRIIFNFAGGPMNYFRTLAGLPPIQWLGSPEVLLLAVLPVVMPGLFIAFLFSLAFSWNELLFALTLTYDEARTLPFHIAGLVAHIGPRYWDIAVQATYIILPMLVLSILGSRFIVRGLAAGTVKG